MPKDVKVSIITVSYNSEATIARTIESVLHQTYKNIEYIIVDGASKDRTVDIIKEYEPFFNGRMRWISEPDDGIYYAMNKGIDMASGELIGLLNSDDTYEPDAAEKMADAVEIGKYQILYGFVRVYKGEKIDCITMVSHSFLPKRMFNHSPCFVTRNIYTDFGKFDTQYISVADYDFMLKMFHNEAVEFVPVYALISNFYLGGMSGTEDAYMDLLRMKRNYGMISNMKYYYNCIRHAIYVIRNHGKGKKKK